MKGIIYKRFNISTFWMAKLIIPKEAVVMRKEENRLYK